MYPTEAINNTISRRLKMTLMRAIISLLCISALLIQVKAQANNSMISPVFEVFENSSRAIANSRNISCMLYQPSGDCGKLLPKYDHAVKFALNTTLNDSISVYETPFVKLHWLIISQGLYVHKQCLDTLISFLCNFIFATCDPAFNVSVQQSVCQQSCETLSVFVCPEKFDLVLEVVIAFINPTLKCDGVMNGGDAPDCIDAVNRGKVPQFSLTTNCFTGRGRGYNGTISITRSGKTCQRWSEQAPHRFILPSSQYPEIAGGHNYCRNPGSRAPDGPWCFTTDPNTRWEYCDVPKCEASSSCQLYYNTTDAVCFGYGSIGYDYVFINSIEGGSIKELNAKLKRFRSALYDSREPHPPECIDIILSLMCHYTFPLCDRNSTTPVPRKVCRSYCEEVNTGRCRHFWNKFKATSKFLIVQLPDCHTLPSPEGGDHLECFIPYNYGINSTDNNLTDCYTDNNLGINYNGTVNVTESGRCCQPWDSTTPHYHPLTSLFRPYLEGHNYCRNPEGRGKRPWCYTMDPAVRWEYCIVPRCPAESNATASAKRINSTTFGLVITISLLVIVLLILVAVICYLCIIKKREQQPNFLYALSNSSNDNNYEETLCNSNYVRVSAVNGIDKLPNISRENITHISELGQGNFGMVMKGEARGVVSDQSSTLVAIKFLKEGSNTDARDDFLHEAVVVNQFDHPNILKLLGVCFDQEPYFITFEYMEFGDLNKYLRNKTISVSQLSSSLTVQQSVDMAIDIAAGLEYLAKHHFVHRDLATRNCLINEKLLVKIADFGLSKDVYSRDYYRLEERSLLPIRWMPPEAILFCKFSTQSDIWSFGVVLWEIFAGGVQPYYTCSNDEVVKFVTNNGMLMCPAGCPRSLYKLMADCWAAVPESRPTASEIYTKLYEWNPDDDDIITPQNFTQTVELKSPMFHGDGSLQSNKETIV